MGFFPCLCLLERGEKKTCMSDGNGRPICVHFTGKTVQGHIYHPYEIIWPVSLEPDESPVMYKVTRAEEYRFGRSFILSKHTASV